MKTVLFNDFVAKPPHNHPMRGDIVLQFEDNADETVYAFPLSQESAEQYYELLGKALGKDKPKIIHPTGADIHAATRTRG